MHRDELGAVGEGRLDLDVVDHLGDALHALLRGDDVGAGLHQVGDAAAVAADAWPLRVALVDFLMAFRPQPLPRVWSI